jgi:hypothetical protein
MSCIAKLFVCHKQETKEAKCLKLEKEAEQRRQITDEAVADMLQERMIVDALNKSYIEHLNKSVTVIK